MSSTIRQFAPSDSNSASKLWGISAEAAPQASDNFDLANLRTKERSISLIVNQFDQGQPKTVGLAIAQVHPTRTSKVILTLKTDTENHQLTHELVQSSIVKLRSKRVRTFKLIGAHKETMAQLWNQVKWQNEILQAPGQTEEQTTEQPEEQATEQDSQQSSEQATESDENTVTHNSQEMLPEAHQEDQQSIAPNNNASKEQVAEDTADPSEQASAA